jgi:DNA-binding NarL/FixJ family response regulator
MLRLDLNKRVKSAKKVSATAPPTLKKPASSSPPLKSTHPAPGPAALKRLLLVDDHPVFREGLACLIEQENAWLICGEIGRAGDVLKSVAKLKPDLVLLDLSLPGGSGLDLIQEILELKPAPRILVLSMHDEAFHGEQALRAGAHGYIMKHEVPEKIFTAILHVLGGGIFASKQLLSQLKPSLRRRQ